jgi:hypothetical protein
MAAECGVAVDLSLPADVELRPPPPRITRHPTLRSRKAPTCAGCAQARPRASAPNPFSWPLHAIMACDKLKSFLCSTGLNG